MNATNARYAHAKRTAMSFRGSLIGTAVIHLGSALCLYGASLFIIFLIVRAARSFEAAILIPPLYVLAGLSLVKIFTIQHDCGHNSFFANSRLNRWTGRFCSILTFIPFAAWTEEHLEHHASFGNLENQTFGDVWLMTVGEYRSAPFYTKMIYRLVRNPIFLLAIAPLGYLLIRQRFPMRLKASRICSALIHSCSVCCGYGLLICILGSSTFVILMPILYIAGTIAVLIFTVEHQFEGTHWSKAANWKFFEAAVGCSSYLSMPRWLEWFTGNIGYHHVHHFSPKVPSYRLRECFLAIGSSLPHMEISWTTVPRNLRLALWSEEKKALVAFRQLQFVRV